MLHKKYIKIVSIVTAIFFIATNLYFPSDLYAQMVSKEVSAPIDIKAVQISPDAGSVYESYKAEGRQSPISIVLIQDAHGIYDAQKNIRSIIQELQDKHGFNLVALEGGDGKADHTLFRTFPDQEINRKQADQYMERAELSGGEVAAMTNPKEGTFYGIEDRDLYFKNRNNFLKALDQKTSNLGTLKLLERKLDKIRDKIYPPELLKFHKEELEFKREQISLIEFLEALRLEAQDARRVTPGGKYPNLSLIFQVMATDRDGSDLAEPSLTKKEMEVKERELTVKVEGHKLFEEMGALSKETKAQYFTPHPSPLPQGERGSRKPSPLMGEGRGEGDIKTLDTLYSKLEILEQMASLEIAREDYQKYVTNKKDYDLAVFLKFLDKYKDSINLTLDLSSGETFYQGALQRDEVLYQNLMKAIRSEKQDRAIAVVGGFHTEGLRERLRKDGVSYLILSPRIERLEADNPYWKVIQGQVSYKKIDRSQIAAPLITMGMSPEDAERFANVFLVRGLRGLFSELRQDPKFKEKWKSAGAEWRKNIITALKKHDPLASPEVLLKMAVELMRGVAAQPGGTEQIQATLNYLEKAFSNVAGTAAKIQIDKFIGSLGAGWLSLVPREGISYRGVADKPRLLTPDQMEEIFNKRAKTIHEVKVFGNYLRSAHDPDPAWTLGSELAKLKNETLLEVGTGTNLVLINFLINDLGFHPKKIYAIDPTMMEDPTGSDLQFTEGRFVQGSIANSLPSSWENIRFDRVFGFYVFGLFSDKELQSTASNIYKVLKSGGRVGGAGFNQSAQAIFKEKFGGSLFRTEESSDFMTFGASLEQAKPPAVGQPHGLASQGSRFDGSNPARRIEELMGQGKGREDAVAQEMREAKESGLNLLIQLKDKDVMKDNFGFEYRRDGATLVGLDQEGNKTKAVYTLFKLMKNPVTGNTELTFKPSNEVIFKAAESRLITGRPLDGTPMVDWARISRIKEERILGKSGSLGAVFHARDVLSNLSPRVTADDLARKLAELEAKAFGDEEPNVERWDKMLGQTPGAVLLLVDPQGRLQGFISKMEEDGVGNLEQIITEQDGVRGRGELLMDAYLGLMKKRGIKTIKWIAALDSPGFYHRYLASRLYYDTSRGVDFTAYLDSDTPDLRERWQRTQEEYLKAIKEREQEVSEIIKGLVGEYVFTERNIPTRFQALEDGSWQYLEGDSFFKDLSPEVRKKVVVGRLTYRMNVSLWDGRGDKRIIGPWNKLKASIPEAKGERSVGQSLGSISILDLSRVPPETRLGERAEVGVIVDAWTASKYLLPEMDEEDLIYQIALLEQKAFEAHRFKLEYWQDRFRSRNGELFLLFDRKGRLSGFLHGIHNSEKRWASVITLATDPGGPRGRGEFLMDRYLSLSKVKGAEIVEVISVDDAIGFYHRVLSPRVYYTNLGTSSFTAYLKTYGGDEAAQRLRTIWEGSQNEYLGRVKAREEEVDRVLKGLKGEFLYQDGYSETSALVNISTEGDWGLQEDPLIYREQMAGRLRSVFRSKLIYSQEAELWDKNGKVLIPPVPGLEKPRILKQSELISRTLPENELGKLMNAAGLSLGKTIMDALKDKEIDPNQFTTLIYPAAGNNDVWLVRRLIELFPKLEEVHLISMSYQDPLFDKESYVKRLSEGRPGMKVELHAVDYLKFRAPVRSEGRRIILDKWPGFNGELRAEKGFYEGIAVDTRPGDLVLAVPAAKYPAAKWAGEIAQGMAIPGYPEWDNWIVSVRKENDAPQLTVRGRSLGSLFTTARFPKRGEQLYDLKFWLAQTRLSWLVRWKPSNSPFYLILPTPLYREKIFYTQDPKQYLNDKKILAILFDTDREITLGRQRLVTGEFRYYLRKGTEDYTTAFVEKGFDMIAHTHPSSTKTQLSPGVLQSNVLPSDMDLTAITNVDKTLVILSRQGILYYRYEMPLDTAQSRERYNALYQQAVREGWRVEKFAEMIKKEMWIHVSFQGIDPIIRVDATGKALKVTGASLGAIGAKMRLVDMIKGAPLERIASSLEVRPDEIHVLEVDTEGSSIDAFLKTTEKIKDAGLAAGSQYMVLVLSRTVTNNRKEYRIIVDEAFRIRDEAISIVGGNVFRGGDWQVLLDFTAFRNTQSIYLDNVAVHSYLQRRGIASQMFEVFARFLESDYPGWTVATVAAEEHREGVQPDNFIPYQMGKFFSAHRAVKFDTERLPEYADFLRPLDWEYLYAGKVGARFDRWSQFQTLIERLAGSVASDLKAVQMPGIPRMDRGVMQDFIESDLRSQQTGETVPEYFFPIANTILGAIRKAASSDPMTWQLMDERENAWIRHVAAARPEVLARIQQTGTPTTLLYDEILNKISGQSLGAGSRERELSALASEIGFGVFNEGEQERRVVVARLIQGLKPDMLEGLRAELQRYISSKVLPKVFSAQEAALMLLIQSSRLLSGEAVEKRAGKIVDEFAREIPALGPEEQGRLKTLFTSVLRGASLEAVQQRIEAEERDRQMATELYLKNTQTPEDRIAMENAISTLSTDLAERTRSLMISERKTILVANMASFPEGAEQVREMIDKAFQAAPKDAMGPRLDIFIYYTEAEAGRTKGVREHLTALRKEDPYLASKIHLKHKALTALQSAFLDHQKKVKPDENLIFVVPELSLVSRLKDSQVLVHKDSSISQELSFARGVISQAAVGLAEILRLSEGDPKRTEYLNYLHDNLGFTVTRDPELGQFIIGFDLQTLIATLVDLQRAQQAIRTAA